MEKENEEDDWIKTCDPIKQIRMGEPNEIIEKVYRRGNRAGGVQQLVVELNKTANREILLKHSKFPKGDVNYGNVYLAKNEIVEKIALKTQKREKRRIRKFRREV